MHSLHKKFVNLHYTALDQFSLTIPDNYPFKEDIIKAIAHIKNKLGYTAPEIVNTIFCNYIQLLISKHLPTTDNDWAIKGWKILTDSCDHVQNLTLKEYNL